MRHHCSILPFIRPFIRPSFIHSCDQGTRTRSSIPPSKPVAEKLPVHPSIIHPSVQPSIQCEAKKLFIYRDATPPMFVPAYLEDVLCVVHAVDPDVVLQRGAVRVGEEHQPQALGCAHVQRLSHQRQGAQLLGENAARLGLKLAVIGLRHQLFPHQQDILGEGRGGRRGVRGEIKTRCEWKVKHSIHVGGKGNGFA